MRINCGDQYLIITSLSSSMQLKNSDSHDENLLTPCMAIELYSCPSKLLASYETVLLSVESGCSVEPPKKDCAFYKLLGECHRGKECEFQHAKRADTYVVSLTYTCTRCRYTCTEHYLIACITCRQYARHCETEPRSHTFIHHCLSIY